MNVPRIPLRHQSKRGELPMFWADNLALDGTVAPWKNAPLGSLYIDLRPTEVTLYLKTANAGATADWDALDVV